MMYIHMHHIIVRSKDGNHTAEIFLLVAKFFLAVMNVSDIDYCTLDTVLC